MPSDYERFLENLGRPESREKAIRCLNSQPALKEAGLLWLKGKSLEKIASALGVSQEESEKLNVRVVHFLQRELEPTLMVWSCTAIDPAGPISAVAFGPKGKVS